MRNNKFFHKVRKNYQDYPSSLIPSPKSEVSPSTLKDFTKSLSSFSFLPSFFSLFFLSQIFCIPPFLCSLSPFLYPFLSMCPNPLHSLFSTSLCYATLSTNIKPFCPIKFLLLFKSLSTKLTTLSSSHLFYYTYKSLTNMLWYSHVLNNIITLVWNVCNMDATYVCMTVGPLQTHRMRCSWKILKMHHLTNECQQISLVNFSLQVLYAVINRMNAQPYKHNLIQLKHD